MSDQRLSDQVLFAIASTLEAKELVKFASVSSSLRSLSFSRKVWQKHFAYGELDEEKMSKMEDYVNLYKRCQENKEATNKFSEQFRFIASSDRLYQIDFINIPSHRVLDMLECFTEEELLEIYERGKEKSGEIFFIFTVEDEKRLRCIVEDTARKEIHKEWLNEERAWLLFYKLGFYKVLSESFYKSIETSYNFAKRFIAIQSFICGGESYCADESWHGDSDEYTCDRCGKNIPEGEEEMSYTSKAILCPQCLKHKLTKWAARFVKEFAESDREYIFVDKSDRERAFLYQELEKRNKIKFAKFTAWEDVVICSEHGCRSRSIGDKYICVQGKLDDEKFLCTETLVRSKIRKTVLYKGEGRDRMAWRKLYEDQC
nr:hypothetical protein Cplu_429 [Cedratvirus plubellavi]